MAFSVEMPELGESVTEGTITRWLKEVGDTVETDEPLLEVSTDKVDTEIPSPASGVLTKILAEEDDTVDVGAVIAEIGDSADEADDSGSSDESSDEQEEKDASEATEETSGSSTKSGGSGEATDVEMPELGESVTEGTITRWLKSVGDTVEVDEALLEVSTDKVDTEVPSPVAGTIVEILAEEDDTVDVGAVIVRIGDGSTTSDDSGDSDDEVPSEKEIEASESKEDDDTVEEAADDDSDSGEATDVEMPELGESVTEGTITRWLKSVGDTVEVDEALLEVSTDKVDTEVPSPVAGTIVEILAEEDDTVDVGAVIVRIGDGSAKSSPKKEEKPKQEKPEAEEKKPEPKREEKPEPKQEKPEAEEKKPEPKQEKKSSGNESVPYVTPLVRKLADKHGVDLNSVEGTGVGGRIRKQDVLAAAEGGSSADATPAKASRASTRSVDPEKAKLRGTTQRVNRIREITAKKTLESLHSAAQLTQVHEVDMSRVAELRKANKAAFQSKHGVNLTYLPFFAKAMVEALVSHPNVNASYNAETKEMTYHEDVNLGIAVDTPRGLLSPVIHKAQDMSIPELAKAIVDLAQRARDNKLKPSDLTGGTFTITNIGSEGALTDTPILVPPQAAMVGTGAIVKRPVVVTDEGVDAIAVRQMVFLPMTYDHQVIDGADAGRFMTTVRDRLETGDFVEDLEL
ncbi:2-oxoglutarate dehydrogenase, E2 component, dihydrolipoamide succinyltransferase [Corynebacterium pygosceleis]|uniref:Dihydrolipoamide acetyltransferase component of pyruvate dehydrogenase complex n=1 Tax=Corynebacterium pygosceleis TaxID=2800406 RepID=A0A9Q4C6S1_9CORY|nr:2-oxoglutarate dehydrogenase, E2 component, dihydrolipoamide succinyltransferase [Corynebacterium pygosceleis]MCK7636603.1 2-oxoglutarate dehydrogenase, E2 component, dihydrolipoamide succinyltransferase [Corynebacterium pygosceleis]MCK7675177.1 2-oxoglutarate dehydrogenase, E2 component, dihydrolipoamide succinyltransferase [Corynebacterium pygosceleis]MCX7467356.1 2-oxoglutarate dehydrogenase, E2 component, dihydrolipoamide succinyltransferase [Corynebacterium pygosceleis]